MINKLIHLLNQKKQLDAKLTPLVAELKAIKTDIDTLRNPIAEDLKKEGILSKNLQGLGNISFKKGYTKKILDHKHNYADLCEQFNINEEQLTKIQDKNCKVAEIKDTIAIKENK